MNIHKYIPNLLTISRFVLNTMLLRILIIDFNSVYSSDTFQLITFITLLIFCSDYFDGKLARKLNCCSKNGAYLDITADFYYILSQCLILIKHNIIPAYILICIIFEFAIFIFTSKHIKDSTNTAIVFDMIGKTTAILYYAIPYISIILIYTNKLDNFLPVITVSCVLLTIVAINYRLGLMTKEIFIKKQV